MNFVINEIWSVTNGLLLVQFWDKIGVLFVVWLLEITLCAVVTYFVFAELEEIRSTPEHPGKAAAAPLFALSVLCLLGFIGVVIYHYLKIDYYKYSVNKILPCGFLLVATFVYIIISFILLAMVVSTNADKDKGHDKDHKLIK